ncbi:MAG: 2-phosphosulfolactate phosphatase [Actinomycetota bacterium]
MPSPFDQSVYQVRHDWGVEGTRRLAAADVVIVVDVLRFSSVVTDAVDAGLSPSLDRAREWSRNGAAVATAAHDLGSEGAVVLVGGLRNATAVARAVLTLQDRRQQRTSVSVIAAGERGDDGTLRFAVEDQLGAGAIIAALGDLGIDHTSPEAAASAESFRGLRRALRHLLSACGSARELADGVRADSLMAADGIAPTDVADAAVVDASDTVPQLQAGEFIAFR